MESPRRATTTGGRPGREIVAAVNMTWKIRSEIWLFGFATLPSRSDWCNDECAVILRACKAVCEPSAETLEEILFRSRVELIQIACSTFQYPFFIFFFHRSFARFSRCPEAFEDGWPMCCAYLQPTWEAGSRSWERQPPRHLHARRAVHDFFRRNEDVPPEDLQELSPQRCATVMVLWLILVLVGRLICKTSICFWSRLRRIDASTGPDWWSSTHWQRRRKTSRWSDGALREMLEAKHRRRDEPKTRKGTPVQ